MDFAAFAQNLSFGQSKLTWLHHNVYPEIFAMLRATILDFMVQPQEIKLTIDENGEVEEEHIEDSEQNNLYDRLRETLIYVTNIDTHEMSMIMQARLDSIKNDKEPRLDHLNKLCWALGSISGCMTADEENKFVVTVIKELLTLCEKTFGKSYKAQIATDIMYVVGQFPKFLCSHWAFLRTVIKKLNEFMHEKHPGV